MEHVGMDIGLRESQLAILTEAGEILDKRIRTERTRLVQFFGARSRAKILLEASTESEWIARCLEELGHDRQLVVSCPGIVLFLAQEKRGESLQVTAIDFLEVALGARLLKLCQRHAVRLIGFHLPARGRAIDVEEFTTGGTYGSFGPYGFLPYFNT